MKQKTSTIELSRHLKRLVGVGILSVAAGAMAESTATVPPANTPYPAHSSLAIGADEHYDYRKGSEDEKALNLDDRWDDFKDTLSEWQDATEEQWDEKSSVAMEKFQQMRSSVEIWASNLGDDDVDFGDEADDAIESIEQALENAQNRLDRYDGKNGRKLDRKAGNVEGMVSSLHRTRELVLDLDESNRGKHVDYFWDTVEEVEDALHELRSALPRDTVELEDEMDQAVSTLQGKLDEVNDALSEMEYLQTVKTRLEEEISNIQSKASGLKNASAEKLDELSDSISEGLNDLVHEVDEAL